MTHALLDLHDHELYIGRLTPGSFLIDQDGNGLVEAVPFWLISPSSARHYDFSQRGQLPSQIPQISKIGL